MESNFGLGIEWTQWMFVAKIIFRNSIESFRISQI